MTESNPLAEIEELLHHEIIRERRRALEQAALLLAQGLYREQLRDMLSQVAKNDLIANLAELARQILVEDDHRHERHPPNYLQGAEHMFGGTCPHCAHPNYYDKRERFEKEEFVRKLEGEGKSITLVWVVCKQCGKKFKLEVDLGGYR